MYYESESIDAILRCSYCSTRFIDVIKLVPNCGSSICEECYEDLKDSLNDSNQFKCRECKFFHVMPENGLGDNKGFLKMLQLKPKEKALSPEYKLLKQTIDEVQDTICRLQWRNDEEEIHSYCDSLELEVMTSIESAIKHLCQLEESFLKEIRDYRQRAAAKGPLTTSVLRELNALSREVDVFSKTWKDMFNDPSEAASSQEIQKAQDRIEELRARADQINVDYLAALFNGKLLRFHEDTSFQETNKYSGTLNYESPTIDYKNTADDSRIEAKLLSELAETRRILRAIVLPSKTLASCHIGSTNLIKLWSIETGKLLDTLLVDHECIVSLAVLHNDFLAAGTTTGRIRVWNLEERRLAQTLSGHGKPVFSMKILSDGRLASLARNGVVNIWAPFSKNNHLLGTLNISQSDYSSFDTYCDLGLLSNGSLVTCAYCYQTAREKLKVWDANSMALLSSHTHIASSSWALSLAVLPNDQIAIGCHGGSVSLYDQHCQLKKTVKLSNGDTMLTICLKNRYLVSTCYHEGSELRIWDPVTKKLVKSINTDHADSIIYLLASPENDVLVSIAVDDTVKIWSLSFQ